MVDVAQGFARNYLLPRKLAEAATPAKVAELRKHEEKRARHEAQTFEQAQEIAQKLEGAEIRFDAPAGETGTLFGSVTATDIAERVWETQKVRIDRRKLDLPESIKRIGRYQIPVELFGDSTATLRVAVHPEGGELPPQEELDAIAEAEAEAEAAAQAEAEAEHEQAEAVIETVIAEEETARAGRRGGGASRFPRTRSTGPPTPRTSCRATPSSPTRNTSAQASPQVGARLWNSARTSRSERRFRPQASSGGRGNLCSLMPANRTTPALRRPVESGVVQTFHDRARRAWVARWPSSPRPRRPPRSRRRISKLRSQSSAR